MIERKEYMNLLEKWRDKKAIKVVTGIRRCGKSSLLRMFREKLLSDGVSEEQVQNLNFEDLDNEPFLDYKILYAHVKQNLCPDKMNYLFFDEIQMVENFQKVIDSLFLLDNVDIYVTGSNAYLLSGEIATPAHRKIHRNQTLPFLLPRIHAYAACPYFPRARLSPIHRTGFLPIHSPNLPRPRDGA